MTVRNKGYNTVPVKTLKNTCYAAVQTMQVKAQVSLTKFTKWIPLVLKQTDVLHRHLKDRTVICPFKYHHKIIYGTSWRNYDIKRSQVNSPLPFSPPKKNNNNKLNEGTSFNLKCQWTLKLLYKTFCQQSLRPHFNT